MKKFILLLVGVAIIALCGCSREVKWVRTTEHQEFPGIITQVRPEKDGSYTWSVRVPPSEKVVSYRGKEEKATEGDKVEVVVYYDKIDSFDKEGVLVNTRIDTFRTYRTVRLVE